MYCVRIVHLQPLDRQNKSCIYCINTSLSSRNYSYFHYLHKILQLQAKIIHSLYKSFESWTKTSSIPPSFSLSSSSLELFPSPWASCSCFSYCAFSLAWLEVSSYLAFLDFFEVEEVTNSLPHLASREIHLWMRKL